jgi:hypothetical protein
MRGERVADLPDRIVQGLDQGILSPGQLGSDIAAGTVVGN